MGWTRNSSSVHRKGERVGWEGNGRRRAEEDGEALCLVLTTHTHTHTQEPPRGKSGALVITVDGYVCVCGEKPICSAWSWEKDLRGLIIMAAVADEERKREAKRVGSYVHTHRAPIHGGKGHGSLLEMGEADIDRS